MQTVHVLHHGCVSSVFLASKPGSCDHEQKVVKAYHKNHLQVRHWLNITREVTHLRQIQELGVPGIVELCGTADDASNIYLVFQPCFGGDLYKRLAHRGLYEEAQLCKEVVTPLLKVLHSLHQLGIIHRDIKPENIFFESNGTLRLGDFGLAISSKTERPISRVGTPDYMAPEVLAQPSADVIAVRKIRPAQLPSYDCKVDIWALGVLIYEALIGVTPFSDADPQAACLRAQFRAPRALHGVSATCSDFVAQALAKQAAKRPSAVQLLAHPWVKAHMTAQDVEFYSGQASSQQGSGASCMLSRASSGNHFSPRSTGLGAHGPVSISQALSAGLAGSSSLSCELSSSAPSSAVLSAASSLGLGLQWQPQAGPSGSGPLLQPSPIALPKPQPKVTQPQQLPQHPFAAAAVQYGAARMLLGAVPPVASADAGVPETGCSLVLPPAGGPMQAAVPLAIPEQHLQGKSSTARKFLRQFSSPARLRDPQLALDEAALSGPSDEAPGSPNPTSSSSRPSLDRIALAMSPMRALLGAGRNVLRSRSGAAAPTADGAVAVPNKPPASVTTGFNLRSPLTSPIRGLLQGNRRRPAHANSASSLFAAAHWKPGVIPGADIGSCADNTSSNGASASPQCAGPASAGPEGCCSSGPKGMDCASFMRACSMGPNTVLGAGLCSNNTTAAGVPGEGGSSAGSTPAAAAAAAVGQHAKGLPAPTCGPGGSGEQAHAAGRKPVALLNRYPSAPDPGPLLALSPARGVSKGLGIPPAPVPMDRTGSNGMWGVWLKMQGVCRMVKQGSKDAVPEPDADCVVSRNP